MKISYNWLKKYAAIELPPSEVGSLLTEIGLEVEHEEAFESIKGGLIGLVVGDVKTCIKHPNADKLSLTTVDVGGPALLNIVCGAANVAVGQKVIIATDGATLYPYTGESFKIKKSKIRGEVSEGMICAEDEIGLGASHAGIMVLPADTKVGMPASDYFKIYRDTVFEIGLTPNRADAISHIGVARDLVAAINIRNKPSQPLSLSVPKAGKYNTNGKVDISVTIQNPEACKRYCGITVSGIKVAESPQWLKDSLSAIGLRPINNIVDITNYVMHETGQPLHAFDANKIKGGKVIVRKAKAGEAIITLDGTERKLHVEDLLICNESDAMCIAGVYGGIESGVKETTTRVFIESAYFEPSHVRKTARRYSLHTDASFRFERGVDIGNTPYAMQRATDLIMEACPGAIVSTEQDVYPVKAQERHLDFSPTYGRKLLGHDVNDKEIENIILNVGIGIVSKNGESWKLNLPTYRMDITTQADIVEEIARFYGYNNIPIPATIKLPMVHSKGVQADKVFEEISLVLTSNGFTEIMNTSLTSSKFGMDSSTVKLANPLSSDLDVLRSAMLNNGLVCINRNQNNQWADLKLFEFGRTYTKSEKGFTEEEHLSLWVSGNKAAESWNTKQTPADFYFLKGFVMQLLEKVIGKVKYEEAIINDSGSLANGITLSAKNKTLVTYGEVSHAVLKAHDIKGEVYYADFNWKNILSLIPTKHDIKEIVRFPLVSRDLALVIEKNVQFAQLKQLAYQTEKELLKEVSVFDVYMGDKVEQGKKSYAIRFLLQSEHKTLTDKEIDKVMEKLVKVYEEKAGATVRTK
ncbi:MAG TPA: phenylalanine--tRNA ligase subunit beta [Bacteroidia bacterium]|jgi:phenylalanyl-tRNA synthetase beta chain|nr:phenylalanine--tRNA ligase subunit beta [Bacteroidia bacterium]